MKEKIKELTLLFLHLNSWEEEIAGEKVARSWKTFRFEVLDELASEGMIGGSKKAKSVMISDEGIKAAKELARKYGINPGPGAEK